MGIDGNERDVAVNIPLQLGLWLTADISGIAVLAGSDEDDRVVVNPVSRAFAPEEIPVQR